ncbi:PAQR family membrane homeostasis protein TrhA [Legionella worsleiensis]|uniref:Hemolysin, inner membrane subunit n=1 Tax=Legionella worsleiensis TaxID=45076 RepID=A0A0W1ALA3_9GAMM|nr:hemolysin III family protein [Legionella worsleiensis]KTD81955.1 hemolysin, inner membrane subunit [Legionella worsleiensis]STY31322.1 hemolysin, inner membrane subunit [Legionella worsleiensis]
MPWIKPDTLQTRSEEIGNATTHALGALLSLAAITLLVIFSASQSDGFKLASGIVFGCTLFLMYLSSTVYHSLTNPRLKHYFRIADHASIYLLIAGSYTPFMLVTLRDSWGWTMFVIIWSLALAGVIFKLFLVHKFELLSTVIYLMMGWMSLIVIKPIYQLLPAGGLACIVAGGLCYTVGVIFYAWERLKYSHVLWHLFVLAGSIFHFFAVLCYVVIE